MNHFKLISIVICAANGALLKPEPTIVSIRTDGDKNGPKFDRTFAWSETLMMGTISIRCNLTESRAFDAVRALQWQSRLSFECLSATCPSRTMTNHGSLKICPNDRVELGDEIFTYDSRLVGDTRYGWFQAYQGVNKDPDRLMVSCIHDPISSSRKAETPCRLGSLVGDDLVVSGIFANGSALVSSIMIPRGKSQSVRLIQRGSLCPSFGIFNSTIESLIHRAEVNETSSPRTLTLWSPLCFGNRASTFESLLEPLRDVCLAGDLIHRQVDICLGDSANALRIIQLIHGSSKPWPTSISFSGKGPKDWSVDESSKFLEKRVSTNQFCGSVQPSITEEYKVTIMSANRFSLRAVSGSFAPLQFPGGRESAEGIIYNDGLNPQGCSESSYESLKIPANAHWIALVDRGGCMFQEKTLIAQRKGAQGIIIVNTVKRSMIPAMASIAGKPAADIPAVLTDTDGLVLKAFIGTKVRLEPAPYPGEASPGPNDHLDVVLRIGCLSTEPGYAKACEVGDQVLLEQDGDVLHHSVEIVEKLNPELYVVIAGQGFRETVPGWRLFKESDVPCTSQLGSFVKSVERTGTCELTATIHSALVCADERFREPLLRKRDVNCVPVT
jgi:hypothetical protein